MDKSIKIILASLLLLCLANMPYGYYELIRLISLIGFSILAYQFYLCKRHVETTIYITLALLFQPFFKVALGRALWNIVDLIVAIWLLATIWTKPKWYNPKTEIKEPNAKKDKLLQNKEQSPQS